MQRNVGVQMVKMNAPTDPGEPADMHYTADCHVPESTHKHQ